MYKENSANYPRLRTDKFFVDYENSYEYNGFIDKTYRFVEEFQLIRPDLWTRFVQQFNEDADYDAGWRGEYWGKMMRGASFVYSYTKNEELYKVLEKTVFDMINSADSEGRISSYGKNHEFDGWDIWSRKYVLLGMQYFMEICEDEKVLEKIVDSMKAQVDYIISKIGNDEGKKAITSASRHWRGLNSSSLLEPIVRLYSITNEKRYLDFAEYIVSCGGLDVANLIDIAYEDKLYPYQYPVTKAYEMISFFEGVLEYYRIVGNEKYKTAIINFANKILESDFTVIGCCGCTHELFDHSTVRQANIPTDDNMQETCVTVTLMKFFYQLTLITGSSKYVDAFETSLYNAYLGAVNTEEVVEESVMENHPDWIFEPLMFDSYSPLVAGKRGNGIGGLKVMSDMHYYGCCACIGSAGIGLVSKMQLQSSKNGFAMNLFIPGTVKSKTLSNTPVAFTTKTLYPKNGDIEIVVSIDKEEEFELLIRNPHFSENTKIYINSDEMIVSKEYTAVKRVWKNGDSIRIELDMRTKAIYPIPYGEQVLMNEVIWGHNYMIPKYDKEDDYAKYHIALRRGPIMLAQENRLGYSVDEPVSVEVLENGYVDVELCDEGIPYEYIVGAKVPLKDGSKMLVTDYASAGKLWRDECRMAVWMKTDEK